MRALAAAGHVEPRATAELIVDYGFLRRVEHRLQMVDDQQTHSLPEDADGLAAIATFLGYAEPAAFQDEMLATLRRVESHYARLFEDAPSLAGPGGNLVFTGTDDDPGTLETLRGAGLPRRLRRGRRGAALASRPLPRPPRSPRARELLTELMPALLKALGETAAPDQALLNFDLFLGNLPAGVQLFSLFKSNPALLELVAAIMGSAPGLAAQLARRTVLLDSVLSSDFYAALPSAAGDDRRARPPAGPGRGRAGHPRRGAPLGQRPALPGRRAAAQAHGAAGAGRPRLFRHRRKRPSRPCATASRRASPQRMARFRGQRLAVLGLGKLGSREMSATSDLDLIFVYDIPPELEASDGAPAAARRSSTTRGSAPRS